MRNQSIKPDDCSDCLLGVLAIELGSPVGFEDTLASQFASATTKCNATGYGYTKTVYPTFPTTQSTSSSSSPSTTPTSSVCPRSYTIRQNDTCNSIALDQKASTYGIIMQNFLDIFCSNLPGVGTVICLPEACSPYSMLDGDTCRSIATSTGITQDQLLALNPIFDQECSNYRRWWGFVLCIG
ncbi:carbohydrate-binding module family 50 protein [Stipitochalara longipes BDJ]|nr:carbohydrate-binding module family 50 protein [Stipitochalara longipes BDJ]